MNFLKAGRPAGFFARIAVAVLIMLTVAVSCVLYQTTKHNQSGTQLSSYTLKLETRNHRFPEDVYSFDYSCLYSDRGASCRLLFIPVCSQFSSSRLRWLPVTITA